MEQQNLNLLPGELLITRLSQIFVGLCVAGMVVIIWLSVFTRYVMSDPIAWGEQAAKYLMIWMALVGASLAMRHGSHIAVDLLLEFLPPRLRKVVEITALLLTALFLVMCIGYGISFTSQALAFSDPVLGGVTLAIPYAAIPVGAILMLLQLIFVARHGKEGGDEAASIM